MLVQTHRPLALQLPFGTWNVATFGTWNVATSPLYVIRPGTAAVGSVANSSSRRRAWSWPLTGAVASPAVWCFSGAPTAPVAATAASIMESFIIAFCGGERGRGRVRGVVAGKEWCDRATAGRHACCGRAACA